MPSHFEIPGRCVRHCSPCEHHKSIAAMRGGPGNVWDDYNCMHPEAFDDMPLAADQATRDKQLEIRGRMKAHGRHIGKTEKQPDWCPLRREPANDQAEAGGGK